MLGIAKRLTQNNILTPFGKNRWDRSTVKRLLSNPAYMGTAYYGRFQDIPAKRRAHPLKPVGKGISRKSRPSDQWIPIPVPAIISEDIFQRAQEQMSQNKKKQNVITNAMTICCVIESVVVLANLFVPGVLRKNTPTMFVQVNMKNTDIRIIPAQPLIYQSMKWIEWSGRIFLRY